MTDIVKISRRKFLSFTLAAIPGVTFAHKFTLETEQLKVNRLALDIMRQYSGIIHFTDLHFNGDTSVTDKVIDEFRRQKPDFACFTGDLIERSEYKEGAFAFIKSLGCPVYGVPGNHDYLSGVSSAEYQRAFAATGGSWLENRSTVTADRQIEIIGIAASMSPPVFGPPQAARRILLSHYPAVADELGDNKFTLILAGHSHGGQVRVAFYGPLYLPEGVGRYDRGRFETAAGVMNVSAGLGTSILPIRFNCQPEITIINPV
ncbi:MAG: metallophosphoesterase [Desulfuromonadaceae bacterium]|nr:metallophosphoesterase [Desulfuromonadaceae bacterium]